MPTIDQPHKHGPLMQRAIQRSVSDPIGKLLIDPDAFGTALLVVLIDRYGQEALRWAPQTIRIHLEEDYQVSILPLNFDKLMAAITIVTTDFFFRDLSRFIILTNALCGDGFSFHEFDKADVHECAWAIVEAWMLNPPENPQPFDISIRQYLSSLLLHEGYTVPPGMLRMALNANRASTVLQNFGDDPETLQLVNAAQEAKTRDVDEMVQQNLQELLAQLKDLPLQVGKSKDIAETLVAELKKIRA